MWTDSSVGTKAFFFKAILSDSGPPRSSIPSFSVDEEEQTATLPATCVHDEGRALHPQILRATLRDTDLQNHIKDAQRVPLVAYVSSFIIKCCFTQNILYCINILGVFFHSNGWLLWF